jgi:hypothetical protein
MTDRELLELSAKAAGIEIEWHRMITGNDNPVIAPKTQRERNLLGHEWEEWNPLIDDGDALRLAVKLRLLDSESLTSGEQWRIDYFSSGSDKYAATRRAIVRAAAEIGKELK